MKPVSMSSVFTLFLFELLAIAAINISFCNGSTDVGCIESERQALLRFKQDLKDPSNRLASWTGDGDCCKWAGVVCHNVTSHVVELRLGNPHLKRYTPSDYGYYISLFMIDSQYDAFMRSQLVGKINPSLLEFKQLIYLNLSGNSFEGFKIPTFIGSLRNLKYLDLSYTGFEGMIPHQLGNLSNLQHLDLGHYYYHQLYVENFSWLSSLSLLKHLDLSGIDFSKSFDWLPVVNTLSSLVELRLSECQLDHFLPLPIANLSSLVTLDLSSNNLRTPLICSWIFGLKNLVFIDLSFNNIEGPIPSGFQNFTSLEHFDLSFNYFNLSVPDWLYRFQHLAFLSVRGNSLTGTVSSAVSNLTSIQRLDLSLNKLLHWRIPRSFGRFCKLQSIFLIDVKLSQNISEILNILIECVSEGLKSLDLRNTQLSGRLTHQLEQFKSLEYLRLSYNSISNSIPPFLGKISSLIYLDLSNNNLNGEVSQVHFVNLTRLVVFFISENSLMLKVNHDWMPPFQLKGLRLRSIQLGSEFPSWLYSQKRLIYLDISNTGISDTFPSKMLNSQLNLLHLNLSRNQFYGEIPTLTVSPQLSSFDFSSNNLSGSLPVILSFAQTLDLSNNAFSGTIFQFLCSRKNAYRGMQVLNLRNNFLSGRLPNCWRNWSALLILNLANNEFTGHLPTSLGTLHDLQSLHLGKNSFSGMIPTSLKNCKKLVTLDISGNEFVGNVPTWIGETFSRMRILSLHSNKFHGFLPVELCYLATLQILDLSHNNMYGPIPGCISNFSAMVTMSYLEENGIWYLGYTYLLEEYFIEEASLVLKGTAAVYNTILNLVRYIDLSSNNFSGEIPTEVTSLGALQSLNMSHNSFTGRIPWSIGAMRALESIDLSVNQLDGEIPQSISNLSFLSLLNLSNNNLIGKIPLSTQMQSFNASCFVGNKLCGAPLRDCTEISTPNHENGEGQDGYEDEVDWLFYVSIALGFIVGFWSLIGSLLVNRRWRYMYSHFLDRLGDKFGRGIRKCY